MAQVAAFGETGSSTICRCHCDGKSIRCHAFGRKVDGRNCNVDCDCLSRSIRSTTCAVIVALAVIALVAVPSAYTLPANTYFYLTYNAQQGGSPGTCGVFEILSAIARIPLKLLLDQERQGVSTAGLLARTVSPPADNTRSRWFGAATPSRPPAINQLLERCTGLVGCFLEEDHVGTY